MVLALKVWGNLELPESEAPDVALTAARVMTRALAKDSPENVRLALARAFGVQTVATWWRALDNPRSFPLRPLLQDFPTFDLPDAVMVLAESVGRTAARLDAEAAAHLIGQVYTGMLPGAFRGTLGVYYTPPGLTSRLLDLATLAGVDWARARILDPACGGGAFLTPVAQRIIGALPDVSPSILIKNIGTRLRGQEIDPFAAWLSQVSLDAVLLPVSSKANRILPVVVKVCDSLASITGDQAFDLVVGNPPYGRVTLSANERQRFRRSLYGHSNLYGLFTDIAMQHLSPEGVIAYVTPTSFLAGEYFKNLRKLMAASAPPVVIDFVTARTGVFDDVMQETLLAAYKRSEFKPPVLTNQITLRADGHVDVEECGRATLPSIGTEPWLLPRKPSEELMVRALARLKPRLADWGYAVKTGPLVWNRHKGQLAHDPTRQCLPLIWAEAVTAQGQFVFRADRKNHAPYFEMGPDDDWLRVTEPCVLLQRTTAKEQSRRLIAAHMPASFVRKHGAVIVENHLNMVRAIGTRPKVAFDVLAAFLNSAAADRVFRCLNGSVAVSAYEIESLPLPPVESLRELTSLVNARAPTDAIEKACEKLYA